MYHADTDFLRDVGKVVSPNKRNDKNYKGVYSLNKTGYENVYNKGSLKDSNKKDTHLHALKEVVSPNNLNNFCFSLRALRSRFESTNHRNVETGRGKVSNTFAKTTRGQTMAKKSNGSISQPGRFLSKKKIV